MFNKKFVKIIAILFLIISIGLILNAIISLLLVQEMIDTLTKHFSDITTHLRQEAKKSIIRNSITSFIIGILLFLCSVGLLKIKKWAWYLSSLMACSGISYAVITIIINILRKEYVTLSWKIFILFLSVILVFIFQSKSLRSIFFETKATGKLGQALKTENSCLRL